MRGADLPDLRLQGRHAGVGTSLGPGPGWELRPLLRLRAHLHRSAHVRRAALRPAARQTLPRSRGRGLNHPRHPLGRGARGAVPLALAAGAAACTRHGTVRDADAEPDVALLVRGAPRHAAPLAPVAHHLHLHLDGRRARSPRPRAPLLRPRHRRAPRRLGLRDPVRLCVHALAARPSRPPRAHARGPGPASLQAGLARGAGARGRGSPA
mmetsp:Transcript_7590/g.17883  ORF Transcript_7590/g.17883 Transcript_7590/m.17883 type:complete len:210 (+) Transcript_7590:1513-2142(+)